MVQVSMNRIPNGSSQLGHNKDRNWDLTTWIHIVAATSLLGVATCAPNDETAISSYVVGCSCRVSASSCVIKDHFHQTECALLFVMNPAEISAIAVFKRQTLMCSAESGGEVIRSSEIISICNIACSQTGLCLTDSVLSCWLPCKRLY